MTRSVTYWSSEIEIRVSVPSLNPKEMPVICAVWDLARPMYTKEASCSTGAVPTRCGVEAGLLLALPKGKAGCDCAPPSPDEGSSLRNAKQT